MKFIMMDICLPVSICLGMALALPYVIAHTVVPALGESFIPAIYQLIQVFKQFAIVSASYAFSLILYSDNLT